MHGYVCYIVSKIIYTYAGRRFNDPILRDNYPKGIKGEPKLADLLTHLKDTNISYVFGQVGQDVVQGEIAELLEREFKCEFITIHSIEHTILVYRLNHRMNPFLKEVNLMS